jgi:hypothetical protein
MSPAKRSLLAGLIASSFAHALVGWFVYRASPVPERADEPPVVVMDFDIYEAPTPPPAELPAETAPVPLADIQPETPESPAAPEPVTEVAPETDQVASDEFLAVGTLDAGVPDATIVAENSGFDAGSDEDLLTVTEVENGDADETFAANVSDAVSATARLDTGGLDRLVVASALDTAPVAGQGPASTETTPHSPSQANLLAYMPEGELLTVLVRFDRLRDTEWAERTEAILAPMPDYRGLIGGRDIAISSFFDSLAISSPAPREVTATTLAGHTVLPATRLRSLLDHPAARVSWRVARGGALGVRQRSRLIAPHDQRVFLMPFADWVVLTHPRNLGALVEPASGDWAELDARLQAATAIDELPPWLAVLRGIEREAGQETGPALLITVARLLPPVWEAPYVGEPVPTPERTTLALEVTDKGFFVRGTMVFADAATAGAFVATVERVQRDFAGTRVGRMVLSRVKAYNAIRGLSLAQNQALVGFATSISTADARAAMDFAAEQTRRFFGQPAPRQVAPAPKIPAPGSKIPAPKTPAPRIPAPAAHQ